MEKIKGYEYTIEINDNLEGFALSVLQLVNMRSSRKDVIHDIRTIEGTKRVVVVAYEGIDSLLSRYHIISKEEVVILDVGYDDYDIATQKELESLIADYYNEKIERVYVGHEIM